MNQEEYIEKNSAFDKYPDVHDKLTRSEISQQIQHAVQVKDGKHLTALFHFMLVNEYTPDQLHQELDVIFKESPELLKVLIDWGTLSDEKRKQQMVVKSVYLTGAAHFYLEDYQCCIKVIHTQKNINDAVYEFKEALNELEQSSWLGLLQQQVGKTPLHKLMTQLNALQQSGIWSKELALFALPIAAGYFRELAAKEMEAMDYSKAFRLLEKAHQLSEKDKQETYLLYLSCLEQSLQQAFLEPENRSIPIDIIDRKMRQLEVWRVYSTDLDEYKRMLNVLKNKNSSLPKKKL